jgi:UDP-glucose 4-epimerase
MVNILVTGSNGFLGGAVVEELTSMGHSVIGLDPQPAVGRGFAQVTDDLSKTESLLSLLEKKEITHVIHAGGVSGPMVLTDEPSRVIDINVKGSLNLLQACLKSGVETFVYCSSVSALGNFYEKRPVDDDYPLHPINTYGCSKAAVDMALRGLYRRVPIDLCSLRFTSIYGPGRRTSLVIHDIIEASFRGQPAVVDPSTDWPYIYIDDAVTATIDACFSSKRKQLHYFIAYPEQISIEQVAAIVGETIKPIEIIVRDGSLARRGPLNITPASRDFSFAPQIDCREGIRRMIAARA